MPNAKFIDKNGKDVTEDVKKSHNVAKNVAQANSQDLTEQYKTRTLPNNFYYFDNGKTQYIVEYHNLKGIEGLEGVKVLERVPSYEEWQQMKAFCEEFNALNVAEENDKLKKLLEECGIFLDVHRENDGNVFINDVSTSQMIDKINEDLK